MYSGKRFFVSCLYLVFLGVLCLFIAPLTHSASTITVETELQATLNSYGQAGYMIFFREKPNLSQAYTMGWKNRGEFVMNSLQSAATRAQAGVQEYLKQHNVSYKTFWIDNIIVVESSSKAVFDGLLNIPEIESIKARRTMQLHEPIKDEGTKAAPMAVGPNIAHVRADDVWGLGITGAGIVVANIDTGVKYTHEALVGQYRGNLGGGSYNHNYNWWDPSNICGSPSTAPCDNNGHGSHTMGTIIGDDATHTNQIGMAPGARWIACKGCEDTSCSDAALLGCAQFIMAPTDLAGGNPNTSLRPHVVNNSWGGGGGNTWYQTSVDNWHAAGIYPVFSAGNSGPGCNTVGSPGDYGNVTAVGAIDHATNFPASFSSRGPGAFDDDVNPTPGLLRLKPQVAAPGVNICSSIPDSDISYSCAYSGTSMAAPHVAGLVALMWNAAPCIARNYALTETIIQNTATGLTTTETCGGLSGIPNNTTGYGLINALAAVQTAIAQCGPSGTLQGTVIDTLTSNPVEDALVSASGRTEMTNASGQYSFTLMPVGSYDVTVDIYGYQPITATRVAITEGVTTTQDFALSAGRLEVDVPFIDIAIPANTIASRGFTILNSGLITAGFEINDLPGSVLLANGKSKLSPYNSNSHLTNNAQDYEKKDSIIATTPTFSSSGHSKSTQIASGWVTAGEIDLILDDGSAENSIGLGGGGQFVWLNRFSPNLDAFPFNLEQVSLLFGSATNIGDQIELVIWEDTDNDGNPGTGASFLFSQNVTVQYNDLLTWNNYTLTQPVLLTGPGDVLIGVVNRSGYSGYSDYPAVIDTTSSQNRSWIGNYTSGNPPNPPTLPADSLWGTIDSYGFSGNLTLRGNGSAADVSWLSVSPITGTIPVGYYTTVDVDIDSTGLTTGNFGALLKINNTTPYGTVTIPVRLIVVPASAKQYNLTAKKKQVNGGDGIIQSSDSVINCGSTCKVKYYQGPRVSLTATAYPGSTFTGWLPTSLNCPGTGPCVVTMNKSKKAQAVFVGDYSVTVQKKGNGTGRVASQDGGIDCGSACTVKYPVHTTVTLTATPDRGMKFVKWLPSKLCPVTGSCQVTLDKAKKVTAYFDIQ